MRKEKHIKNITIGLLDCMLGIAEGFVVSADRREVYKRAYGYFEQKLTVRGISKYFDSLRRRGYIELVEDKQGSQSVRFTNKAKLALVDKITDKLSVDNRFYFVSFDIPERLRRNRDSFRQTIKRLGFKEIQKSLWAYNKNVGEYVEMAAVEYGVMDFVVYLVSDNTNINDILAGKISGRVKKVQ